MEDHDLFGNIVERDVILREKFIEPPFSIIDARSGNWQRRKKLWKSKGIRSEVGRGKNMTHEIPTKKYTNKDEYKKHVDLNTSIFDPALAELIYKWFCPDGGRILDPFAGGSVRGIVANYLGYKYTGIDIRPEQVMSNKEQAAEILKDKVHPIWIMGDSDVMLDYPLFDDFDLMFSCPPYGDLEVYSDLDGDISNMGYNSFLKAYRSIIRKGCYHILAGGFACFVVGEIRDKKGGFRGFVPDTIKAFTDAGMTFYNEAILCQPVVSASMRADKQMTAGRKLVKTHQNILIFKKI
jgi:hypothetical protein